MKIKKIFTKDLFRPINGVVKAEQQDDAIVWQELDEYVVTRELDRHLRKFLNSYISAKDHYKDPVIAGQMGVWVSGFFGSGKSHFIKILSYLLSNREAHDPDSQDTCKAIDFFSYKIKDTMLFADLKKATQTDTDVILFNIDSKANAADGRAALLSVFWRVFNEMQGFCGEHPHIAELERYLVSKGKLEEFCEAFKTQTKTDWKEERDAYRLRKDEVVQALSTSLDMTQDSAKEWFDKAEDEFNLSIEGFAERVKEYLDSKGNNRQLIFLVDEVGQFIGEDTHLMLNLQTLIEDLGRICQGRVWVVVTSQEDIDSVLGEIKISKANDFSKIQGRFYTRLSLSGSNTDEVIQTRLLEKTEDARQELTALFEDKGEILKNQLTFSHDSATLKNFNTGDDFVSNYPFAPYHFKLVQETFEAIRKAGATGLHLSHGERSMLDAFQSAAKKIADKEIGALVPFYDFYPSIQGFLDSVVKRSIDQAGENAGLEKPFDIQLLQALFLVRYVKSIKPNVDNLVTLCIDEVDADRLALKHKIEEALQRLEKENLVNRSGDLYFFLTNEEREVTREIKGVELDSTAESNFLSEIIFDEVLKRKNKHRFDQYKRDYSFSRICDGIPYGAKAEQDIVIEVITPLYDQFSMFNETKCIMHTSEYSRALIVLPEHKDLLREVRTFKQTEKYIRLKSDSAASPTLKRILEDQSADNRSRKSRIITMVNDLMVNAEYYALGNTLQVKGNTPGSAVDEALNFLIRNRYNKFGYLIHLCENPQQEVKAVLLTDDLGQQQLKMDLGTVNANALKELRTVINLKKASNQTVILSDLVEQFSGGYFGWPEWEVVLLVARLFMGGEISLSSEGAKLQPNEAVGPMTKTGQWKTIKIHKRKVAGERDIKTAQKLGQDLFGSIGGDKQDDLTAFLRDELTNRKANLDSFRPLANTGNYPGKMEIDESLATLNAILSINDPYEFIIEFNKRRDELLEASDNFHDLKGFYNNQINTWEALHKAIEELKPNATILAKYPEAASSWEQMTQISEAPAPYGMIKEVNGLISKVKGVNTRVVEEKQAFATAEVDKLIEKLKGELDAKGADGGLRNKCLYPLQTTKKQIQGDTNVPQIMYRLDEAKGQYDEALGHIEEAFGPKGDKKPPKPVKTITPSNYTSKVYLETEEEVESFVSKVRDDLLAAVKKNMRIKIQ
ncbi:MAG: BREX system P-loop protein BrxC [Deltaproteobacteria bacterium]|nr:BREX system P-loop protein BrxC [Deltaproteobacteria bacterium]